MGLALHCCWDWPNWRDERRKKGQTHRHTTDILGSVQPCAFWWRCTSNSNLQTQHLYSLHLNQESGLIVCSWLRRHASQSQKETFVESSLQSSLRKLWLTVLACMGQSFVNTCIGTEESIAIPLNLTRESVAIHGSETLGSLTKLCTDQQHTLTQVFLHPPQTYAMQFWTWAMYLFAPPTHILGLGFLCLGRRQAWDQEAYLVPDLFTSAPDLEFNECYFTDSIAFFSYDGKWLRGNDMDSNRLHDKSA